MKKAIHRITKDQVLPLNDMVSWKASVVRIASQLGLGPLSADWTGCGPVWSILEQMANEGAVFVIKIDGERTIPDDNGRYTVVLSGGALGDQFFRLDTKTLDEGLARAIVFYASKCWD